ncbi:MAG: type II secretion system F family protein [Bacillota bacterium]
MIVLTRSLLIGLCAGTLGAWILGREDARLRDFRPQGAALEGERPQTGHVRVVVLAAGALLPVSTWVRTPSPVRAGLWVIVVCGALILGYEARLKRNRLAEMRNEWPAFLESMSVAALAGMDITSAFLSAARRTSGALRSELATSCGRVAGGMQLSKALGVLAKEGVPGAERLRALLLQSEVLGTPVSEVLQALALEAATVERQEAEGRFNTLPLKMSIITVLFLLPPVLIVSIAPHMLAFLNSRW